MYLQHRIYQLVHWYSTSSRDCPVHKQKMLLHVPLLVKLSHWGKRIHVNSHQSFIFHPCIWIITAGMKIKTSFFLMKTKQILFRVIYVQATVATSYNLSIDIQLTHRIWKSATSRLYHKLWICHHGFSLRLLSLWYTANCHPVTISA